MIFIQLSSPQLFMHFPKQLGIFISDIPSYFILLQ